MYCNNYFDMTDQGDNFETWYGLRGPAGPQGPAGAPGEPGTSVEMRGPVATTSDLPATASSSEMWLVGSAAPYHGWFYNGTGWEDAGEIAVGPTGPQGETGVTFTPAVSISGVISWTNDGGLPNPESVNIRGPQGPQGRGVATGGSAGQVLKKQSAANYDTAWETEVKCNRNLLDNWYFVKGGGTTGDYGVLPVNQRGQASYSSADYTIDRWKRTAGQTGSKCEVLTTGIHLTNASASGGNFRFTQDGIKVEALGGIGSTLTASVFVVSISGTARQQVNFYDSNGSFISPSYEVVLDGVGVFSKTFTVPSGAATMLYMINNVANAALDVTIGAAKLELGDTQTLAHYDGSNWILNEIPDYCEELAKCQRYFQMFRTQSLRPTYGIDFRPVMATETPTLDSFTKDGVTYYTASSEL